MQLTLAIITIISFCLGFLIGSLLGAKEKKLKYDIKELLRGDNEW